MWKAKRKSRKRKNDRKMNECEEFTQKREEYIAKTEQYRRDFEEFKKQRKEQYKRDYKIITENSHSNIDKVLSDILAIVIVSYSVAITLVFISFMLMKIFN